MTTTNLAGMSIDFARMDDLNDITRLAKSRRLDEMSITEAKREGFLVSNYEAADYQEFLTRAEHFYVARCGEKLAGFLIAYSSDRVGPEEWLNTQVKKHFDKFVVIKQICVDPEYESRGIASLFYEYVIIRSPGLPIVAAVVSEPENEPSRRLHQRLGFQPSLELTPPDGLRRLVWVRPSMRPEVLLQQYPIAVELYRHEDNLNWSKLNNFLYVTAALIAALGLATGIPGSNTGATSYRVLVVGVGLIGTASSIVFAIALWFGVHYLLARKDAVRLIERLLVGSGGTQVITTELLGKTPKWLDRSPTGTALKFIPIIAGLCWSAIVVITLSGTFM